MKVKLYRLKGRVEDNLPIIKGILGEQLHAGVTDVGVREVAESVIRKAGIAQRDYLGEIKALTLWVRKKTRYTRDPYGAELFRHPRRLIATYLKKGTIMVDCDESAGLLASLLGSIGHNTRIVLIDSHPYTKDISHAIAQVEYLPGSGNWLFLETTMDKPIGWSPEHTREVYIE